MPQQPTIRRAQPLDVVNLYRLVSEQGEFDPFDPSDVAGALRQVLDVIQNGFVLVAQNRAGRLVATIGFDGRTSASGATACFGMWFAVAPPYRGSSLTADFLDITMRGASERSMPVQIPKMLSPDSPLIEAATKAGFTPGLHSLIWKNKNNGTIRRRTTGRSIGRPGRGRRKQPATADIADGATEPVV